MAAQSTRTDTRNRIVMATAVRKQKLSRVLCEQPNPVERELRVAPGNRLADLDLLAARDIETPLVASLSHELHTLFDPVSEDALPIYFGPLLGRLYLEGL